MNLNKVDTTGNNVYTNSYESYQEGYTNSYTDTQPNSYPISYENKEDKQEFENSYHEDYEDLYESRDTLKKLKNFKINTLELFENEMYSNLFKDAIGDSIGDAGTSNGLDDIGIDDAVGMTNGLDGIGDALGTHTDGPLGSSADYKDLPVNIIKDSNSKKVDPDYNSDIEFLKQQIKLLQRENYKQDLHIQRLEVKYSESEVELSKQIQENEVLRERLRSSTIQPSESSLNPNSSESSLSLKTKASKPKTKLKIPNLKDYIQKDRVTGYDEDISPKSRRLKGYDEECSADSHRLGLDLNLCQDDSSEIIYDKDCNDSDLYFDVNIDSTKLSADYSRLLKHNNDLYILLARKDREIDDLKAALKTESENVKDLQKTMDSLTRVPTFPFFWK